MKINKIKNIIIKIDILIYIVKNNILLLFNDEYNLTIINIIPFYCLFDIIFLYLKNL